MSARYTGYNASKVAAAKFIEDLGAEFPDLHVVNLHPGVGKDLRTSLESKKRDTC